MAANKTPIATDSAEELRGLIGDDASATFESDPNFVNSNPTERASSDNLALRGTDDTVDSEDEEEEEADEDDELEDDELDEDEDEDVEEDEDEEEEDDDEDDEDPDDEDEDDDADEVLQAAEPVDVHGPGKHSREDIEKELEEMEEEDDEEGVVESPEEEDDKEGQHAQRAIDEALRMSAIDIAGQTY